MISQADLELHVKAAADVDTEMLTAFEAEVVAWFEGQTRRYFGAAASVTEYAPGNGQRNLYLHDVPSAVASVTSQGYPGDTQVVIATGDADGWEIRDQHLVRKGGFGWEFGTEYIVVYTRGYTQNDAGPPADIAAPADVQLAIKDVVKALYNEGDPIASAVKSEKIGDYSYTLGDASKGGILVDSIPALHETLQRWSQPNV